jgi:hypothetical protein
MEQLKTNWSPSKYYSLQPVFHESKAKKVVIGTHIFVNVIKGYGFFYASL